MSDNTPRAGSSIATRELEHIKWVRDRSHDFSKVESAHEGPSNPDDLSIVGPANKAADVPVEAELGVPINWNCRVQGDPLYTPTPPGTDVDEAEGREDEIDDSAASSGSNTILKFQGSDSLNVTNSRRITSRAALIVKAQQKEQTSSIVTEKLTYSKRAARAKAQKAAELAKAKVEAKRKLAKEEKAQEKARVERLDWIRKLLGVRIVKLHEVEASIPPLMLKELPGNYHELSYKEKYWECRRVLALVKQNEGEAKVASLVEDVTDKEVEEEGEETAMDKTGENAGILEEHVHVNDGASGKLSDKSATAVKTETDEDQLCEDFVKMGRQDKTK